ncbi:MAG: hypothetical protein JO171_17755 [Paludibacterium sp.]|uniref:hypothetical protein n=1 Tax=Paludibacterium sp. TaxID=1917523 RepID=UPI0025DB1328|nr:hypothetical protein [Paludibacterium sp.]MBV8048999.1 hypothetical protein [Paludibacterium sp.]MBV8647484.1 hypothetical protein [Paludibacterium sp.]
MNTITLREQADVNTEVRQARQPQYQSLTDSRGRVIQLRELDPLQQARLVMAVGSELSTNAVYMNGFALPAAMVAHIDDDFFGFPASISQIEDMLKLLGNEGMAAVNEHLLGRLEAARADAEVAAAKN